MDVRWIAVLAAVGGGASRAEPTGLLVADVALTAAFAGAVSLAGSRGRRWTWLVISAGAFALAGPGWEWRVAGLAVLAGAVAAIVLDLRDRAFGAILAGVAVQVLLHLPDVGPHGTTAVAVAAFTAPVLVSGYRQARSKERRIARLVLLGTAAFVAVAGLAYAGAAVIAREKLTTGIDQATAGLDAARNGDDAEAERLLGQANDSFAIADTLLAGPLAWPARVVPGIGHTAKATAAMAQSGHALLTAASDAATTLDYEALRFVDGRIDLTEIAELSPTLATSYEALLAAETDLAAVESPWLVSQVADPLDRLSEQVTTTLPDAATAVGAVDAAPWLLGGDAPRNYLVLFGQPAESRFGGGFVGTWAELSAIDGDVEMVDSGTIEDLIEGGAGEDRTLTGPLEYVERYARYFPSYNLQNVTASPHFPHVREAISELYPQAGGTGLSGAVYVDPKGVAALLELIGPVEVEGLGEPLTAENAEDFLTVGVYEQFPESSERDQVLQEAIENVFDALTSRDIPGPKDIADTLSAATRGGHLSLSTNNPIVDEFLGEVNVDGALTPVPEGGDYLAVRSANAAPNKLDSYLQRSVAYEATLLPDQDRVESIVTLTLTNTAPASGLPTNVGNNRELLRGTPGAPPEGTAIQYVSIYSPLKAQRATIDGEPLSIEAQRELVRNVYSFPIELAPGESKVVTLSLEGSFLGDVYSLIVGHQPTVNEDQLDVQIHAPADWIIPVAPPSSLGTTSDGAGLVTYSGAQTEEVAIHVGSPEATAREAIP